MFLSRSLKVCLIVLISLIVVDTIDAQRRTRTSTRDNSRNTSRDRQEVRTDGLTPWHSISLGTLGFGGGFSISGKFSYAVKYEDRVSVGVYGKAFYDLINNFNSPDEGLFSYGGGAFTRLNVTEDIFVMGEYSYTSFDVRNNNPRENKLYPSVGGGYKSGYGDKTYGFHVLLPLDDRVRDFLNLEYWIDFNFRF